MSASFRRINYSLRPAKHAERKMLCDVFRRLSTFGRIEEYVYVGFGSIWFSDFSLLHKSLGIKKMISIEQERSAQRRIEDNKPFRIPVIYETSNNALPSLDSWSSKQFLWLDYDDTLSLEILRDVDTVAQHASSGTALVVSVQCLKANQIEEADADTSHGAPSALQRFVTLFGRERVPQGTQITQLYSWPFGSLSRAILLQEIDKALAVRNSNNSTNEMHYRLICEIEYEDGAKMTTLAIVFYSTEDEHLVEQCHFETLDFIPEPLAPIRIKVPILTPREFKKLESQLPLAEGVELELGSMPERDANQFKEMYRYFPNFAVLEN